MERNKFRSTFDPGRKKTSEVSKTSDVFVVTVAALYMTVTLKVVVTDWPSWFVAVTVTVAVPLWPFW